MPGTPLEPAAMARRAAQELSPGAVVALGPGIPCRLPGELPSGCGIWFLADSGVLGFQGPGSDATVEDGRVMCPWHGYTFDVRTGRECTGRGLTLRSAPRVEIDPESDEVWLVA